MSRVRAEETARVPREGSGEPAARA
jgi:hypothetical protein